jgi:hypothetical protein
MAPEKKPRKNGRKTILNPELQKVIVDTVGAGNYLETAAGVAGISISGLHKWLDKGRTERDLRTRDDYQPNPDHTIYVDFVDAVEKARAIAEARAVVHIQRAASDGTWQAAAWFLERTAPKRWGRKDYMTHSGPDGGALEVSITSADLEAKVQALIAQTTRTTA